MQGRHILASENITCVCMGCGKSSDDSFRLEINFLEKCIYWKCPNCKETNKIDLRVPKDSIPLPKMRLM